MAGIYLRNEALKFVGHVQETQSPSYFVPQAQNLAVLARGQEVTFDEYVTFLDDVQIRFPPKPDPHFTSSGLLRATTGFVSGQKPKPVAYAEACILLIGHADMFHRFEWLLNHGEVTNWRRQVRVKFMREIDALAGRCRLTIKAIEEAPYMHPPNLDAIHVDCIERLYLSELGDREDIDEMVAGLNLYPGRYKRCVWPALESKLKVLGHMFKFVSDYFAEVFALAGDEL